MKTVTIDVTAEDIQQGRASQGDDIETCSRCPVALALNRALGITRAYAFYSRLNARDGKSGHELMFTPPTVAKWMRDFDDTELTVKPFSFELTFDEGIL